MMIKTILFMFFASCLFWQLSAQAPVLTIFPNLVGGPQYPNVETTYYIFPWSPDCHVLDTVIGGQVVSQGFYDGKLKVKIVWQAPTNGIQGRIKVVRKDQNCSSVAPGQIWYVSIVSVSTIVPTISGPHSFYMGQAASIPLQAELYSFNDVLPVSFEWQAPPGWIISIYGVGNANAVVYITDNNFRTEGCIKVRGKYPTSGWTEWGDHCLQGTIPAPCPMQLGRPLVLCGDTTEHFVYAPTVVLPQVPQYAWSPTAYTWTVPSTWELKGSNPSAYNTAFVKLDGHTDGVISLRAAAGEFTSATCDYAVNFLPAAPGTRILGPDYVCQTGDFRLDLQPPPASEVTWRVIPLDSATPQVASPDHGSGAAFFQITDSEVSGHFRIVYTVANVCGSIERSKDFFVGKPILFDPTLDGTAYSARPLCPGGHGATTEVDGMSDSAIVWSTSSGATGYPQRDSFVFLLAPTGDSNCPTATASATNVCGTSTLPFLLCPQPDCGQPQLDLLVYPNPAYIIVSLETTAADPVTADYGLIENVQVFNHLGQLVATWHEPPGKRIVKAVVDLPNGLYTLRATVWGKIIVKHLVITRLF